MTTHRTTRCQHCQTLYTFQGSGQGCDAALNSGTHCPRCQRAINEALQSIRARRERVWVETKEVDLKHLLREEQREDEEQAKRASSSERLSIPFKRVSAPMFKMEGGRAVGSDRSGYVKLNRRNYEYRFWPGQEDKAVIRVEMEEDLATGERWPWGEAPVESFDVRS